jgi:hypothetical protein
MLRWLCMIDGFACEGPIRKSSHFRSATMPWYDYLAHFFGGMFLANAVPHFVNGVSGRAFPSPFASPPGRGESSSTVNVLWGAFNLGIAYLLFCLVGPFRGGAPLDVVVSAAGGLVMALMLSRGFGQVYGGVKRRS